MVSPVTRRYRRSAPLAVPRRYSRYCPSGETTASHTEFFTSLCSVSCVPLPLAACQVTKDRSVPDCVRNRTRAPSGVHSGRPKRNADDCAPTSRVSERALRSSAITSVDMLPAAAMSREPSGERRGSTAASSSTLTIWTAPPGCTSASAFRDDPARYANEPSALSAATMILWSLLASALIRRAGPTTARAFTSYGAPDSAPRSSPKMSRPSTTPITREPLTPNGETESAVSE